MKALPSPARAATTLSAPGQARRRFLKQSTGLTFGLALGSLLQLSPKAGAAVRLAPARGLELNAYVHIATDGAIRIYYPAAEMGQGVMTALPVIVAEELDASWDDVRLEPSPPIGEVYGDPAFLNMIFTVATRSVNIYFDRLREFGAGARRVLIQNAAERWQVPLSELRTEPSVVIHGKSGRRLGYGEIAAFAKLPAEMPRVAPEELKKPSQFRLIGTDVFRKDLAGKIHGGLQYSIDVQVPDMVHASVARAPIADARIKSVDDTQAAGAPGVLGIHRGKHQVAVVARSSYEALNARRKLRVDWERVGPANDYDSDKALDVNVAAARDLSTPGLPWDAQGDIGPLFAAAPEIFEREYRSDYMYHAAIEPLSAVVSVSGDGSSAEVWAGTQAPAYTLDTVAKITGVAPERVTVHRMLIGGGFGRRSIYGMDFVEDAAWLAKMLKKPVKVIWTREDDMQGDYFRPMSAHLLRAALDERGGIGAWHHRVACEDPIRRFEPLLFDAWQGAPVIGMHGAEHQGQDGTPLPYCYDLPNRLAEYLEVETGMRVYAMRGVGSVANKFAIESFLDELAAETGPDPLSLRLKLLHRSERAQKVLETAAEMASWGKPRDGRALGMAYSHHGDSMIACMLEVSVEGKSGKIVPHNVWIAVDAGLVIQPDNLRAQLEGGAVFGLSNVLTEHITIKNGVAQQTNFHEYPVMRLPDAPAIHVQLIRNEAHPTSVGEIGTVVVAAAIGNAFAALTGKRLRHIPLTPDRVMQALA
ncbi:MAG: xanthine dehydrogenase family protein molybdopterin-binding subunit [Gammaproteobacteria bacterium]|nr:xanthine dehydrogenase family protein molybdopterin-binding subunit [Gammaproteobacteria bacterium]